MKNASQMMQWGNMPCVRLDAGGYTALIAPDLGSNVIRFRSEHDGVEFFRFSPDNTYETLIKSAEVWGLPTLYLPNRFADGVLRTSDAVYHLPVNEKAPYNNHIHGFLHKRRHDEVVDYKIKKAALNDQCVKQRHAYKAENHGAYYSKRAAYQKL